MEQLGVLRRIDELGRIVIPKGIRTRLKINEGDRVELILSDGKDLIIRKFCPFNGIDEITKKLIVDLEKEINLEVLLCSNEKFLSSSSSKYKYYEGEDITKELFMVMSERRNSSLINAQISPVGEKLNCMIYPIAKNSELIGGLVFLDVINVNEYQNKIILIFRNILMNMLKI